MKLNKRWTGVIIVDFFIMLLIMKVVITKSILLTLLAAVGFTALNAKLIPWAEEEGEKTAGEKLDKIREQKRIDALKQEVS